VMIRFPLSVRSAFESILEGTEEVQLRLVAFEDLTQSDADSLEACIGILKRIWEESNAYLQATKLVTVNPPPAHSHHVEPELP